MTTRHISGQPARRPVRLLLVLLLGIVLGIFVDRAYLAGVVPAALVPSSAVGDFRLMAQAWNLIDAHYVDRAAIKPERMTYAAISGMVDSLGDTGHSTFLTPREVKLANAAIEGHFAGIGAEVQLKGDHVVIVTPIDGTPAQRAHLRPGDIILKVNGKAVAGDSLSSVVDRIRGPAGSKVTLVLRDPRSTKERTVVLVRANIPIHSVSWHILPGTHVADIRIANFSEGTAEELAKILDTAHRAAVRGIILDLRNDPGGLLDQAVDVASLFIRKGNVLLEKNVKGVVKGIPVREDVPKTDLPVVVLINGGTASAAEIVAGALKDDDHALLVGKRSFGTGTVLQQFMLPDNSALLIAVREWLTPNGHTIWHKGIEPGKKVALPESAIMLRPDSMRGLTPAKLRRSGDDQLLAALKSLEARIAEIDQRKAVRAKTSSLKGAAAWAGAVRGTRAHRAWALTLPTMPMECGYGLRYAGSATAVCRV